jgi:hypothetical protein
MPLLLLGFAAAARVRCAFLLRFFAGFCLLANGLYVGVGSFDSVGDAGEMLRHGSQPWQLWLFGLATAPAGLWLWHRQGRYFGIGRNREMVNRGIAYGTLVVSLALVTLGFAVGGK